MDKQFFFGYLPFSKRIQEDPPAWEGFVQESVDPQIKEWSEMADLGPVLVEVDMEFPTGMEPLVLPTYVVTGYGRSE